MDRQLLVELRVINKQLSSMRRTSVLMPKLTQLYSDATNEILEMELSEELDED